MSAIWDFKKHIPELNEKDKASQFYIDQYSVPETHNNVFKVKEITSYHDNHKRVKYPRWSGVKNGGIQQCKSQYHNNTSMFHMTKRKLYDLNQTTYHNLSHNPSILADINRK